MKYINAEKLKAEIDNLESFSCISEEQDGFYSAISRINDIIDSLQQEQPEPSNNLVDVDAVREDFITEVYRVLDADPTNDRANAIIDAFDSLPTVTQEQPEVDLEKEVDRFLKSEESTTYENAGSYKVAVKDPKKIARHFYELGLNARKEE